MSTIPIEDEPDDETPRRDLAEMYASLSNVAAFNRTSLEPILNVVNETVRLQNSGWLKQLAAIGFQPAIPKEQLAALSSTIAAAAIPVITVPEFPAMQKIAQDLSASITAAHAATYADMAAKLTASLPMPDLSGIQELLKSLDTEKWREWLRSVHRPSNWTDEIEGRIDEIIAMIDADGIPVAWVPRGEILQALLDAPSADERSLLLIARRDEILEDCQRVLARVEDEPGIPTLPLAEKVLLGAEDGHWELAALSAVAVVHGVVGALRWASAQQNVAAHHALKTEALLTGIYEDGDSSETLMVDLRGLEPLTPCMPCRCATSCATGPFSGLSPLPRQPFDATTSAGVLRTGAVTRARRPAHPSAAPGSPSTDARARRTPAPARGRRARRGHRSR